ncbi:hypothetical protein OEA41_008050 [Lepraria neglecta]|uniref:Epoxide hydrolase N-terminal domain-containing protein n=1 Tax=Lepraria neglecta TaxID=209136 RepID=A0AAD9ZGT8_9LECA|nr:hypothetical protein OEA41_008050 [Lepraria neglecta]
MSRDAHGSHLNTPIPYKLHIDEELLANTKQKLQLARYPEEQTDIRDDDWNQGAKVKVVKRLADYWKDDYDWRAEEAKINQEFEQYTVKVDIPDYGPQVLHYVHARSSSPTAIPLIFVHGWPGSFLETRKILKPLTSPSNPKDQAFHLIVPSLPGYGPGPAPQKSGFGPVTSAKAFKLLMVDVLGYDKFVTQGGDWGAFVTRSLTMQYPQHVRACHTNFVPCGPPAWYKAPLTLGRLVLNSWLYTAREKQGLEMMQYYLREQNGYLKQQTTRPQSLGFGLGDSPIGLLGWLVEKYHEWMDVAHYTQPDDEVLAFVMMHWMTGATPALRFYKAAFQEKGPSCVENAFTTYLGTPLGFSAFPREIASPPTDWIRPVCNLQWHREHDEGGHFPSVECPEKLVGDLREWFGGEVVRKAIEG